MSPSHSTPELPSFLQPHHLTHVYYPCIKLLNVKKEFPFFKVPYAVAQRYEPLPLIQDPAVEAHTNLYEAYETSFYSVVRAKKSGKKGLPGHRLNVSFGQLLMDMAQVTNGVGETGLEVLTYRDKTDRHDTSLEPTEGTILRVRIVRQTTHITKRDNTIDSFSYYEGNLDELLGLNSPHQWLVDIQDLVTWRSDRAYKHILFRLRRDKALHGFGIGRLIEDNKKQFKSPRSIIYDQHLPLVTTPANFVDIDSDDTTCVICTDLFDDQPDEEHAPITLPCEQSGKSHVLGKSCLTKWCRSQGPTKAQCPHCRHSIFSDSAMLQSLKFGTSLTDPKEYVYDARYTAYENFERSCADLDKSLAAYDKTIVKFDDGAWPRKLTEVFDYFMLPPPECTASTPYHLQPQRRPELRIFRQAIVQFLEHHADLSRPAQGIEENILRYCVSAYQAEIVTLGKRTKKMGMLAVYRSREDLDGLLAKNGHANEGDPDPFWVPMGLWEFVLKAVNRSLKFLVERSCGSECWREKDGLHYHGGRLYCRQSRVADIAEGLEWDIAILSL
ncbi:hypothetical protein LTR78_000434 [Recurvomyces mirabilis]|uniref:RING-type domain-containing protein n=1 Tax=Recurvomyces mirabilis TaxID=574656 RepID=A0AAE1C6K8_9PEZI|nr:hypothetical protein LTR78_000434 [Recurvomyces mirabilis]KAK5162089.1 hypothetical protein LTS14_000435 [Recurvomyces mirabilis]